MSSSSSRSAMSAFLRALSPGTQAVVAAHSTTIYLIMGDLGLDTSDPVIFPKDANDRVAGFDNLWIVEVDGNAVAMVREHLLLDFMLVEVARDRLGWGAGTDSDGEDDCPRPRPGRSSGSVRSPR